MIVENLIYDDARRLEPGNCGLRCNLCHKTTYRFDKRRRLNFAAFRAEGWHIGGENHEDEHICPDCLKKGGAQ